ncbi:hypothetical protein LCGC14_0074480 [marine sediment metagenome]|uniref:Uncharacterized protein n=1 Tax=marine sediment metagenome TaxID=412755 RepID=A0A0F9Y1T8_9ZZZZ|nr:hypothetical protein [Halomonas sp.]HDZ48784.1 hypothetical protein [Halomonas sp.]HEB05449.1 hypothetical protein [Halomonas sp.]
MKLTLNLNPSLDIETKVALNGTVLTVDQVDYDLSELPDGATAYHPVLGKVFRFSDEYECTIRMGFGDNAPVETRFPEPIILIDHSGPVTLPLYNAEESNDELAQ